MSQTYRQWYLPTRTSHNDLAIREQPAIDPSSIPKDSALVKIHAVSIQYRDWQIARSEYPGPIKDQVVPASDGAGEIVALGADVDSKAWQVGDRVAANFSLEHLDGPATLEKHLTSQGGPVDGALSEYKIYPARSLVKIPSHLSYEEASTLPCATLTAYSALLGLVPLKGGDTVLILGTGGVSIAGLQIALASGATVIATTSSKEKAKKVKELGATHVINYVENPNWDEEVLKLTSGRGVDHVVEVGGAKTLLQSLNAVKWNGLIHVIGYVGGADDSVSKFVGESIHKAAITRGVLIGSVAQFESMNRLIEKAKIVPVIDKVFSFDQAKEAYTYLESQKHVGKIVIKVSN